MTDQKYLSLAIEKAEKSSEAVGCGCLIVINGKVIASESNSQRRDQMAINHAEIKAISKANKRLKSKTLKDAVAYCSCEPCAMCLTAMSYAKVAKNSVL